MKKIIMLLLATAILAIAVVTPVTAAGARMDVEIGSVGGIVTKGG